MAFHWAVFLKIYNFEKAACVQGQYLILSKCN